MRRAPPASIFDIQGKFMAESKLQSLVGNENAEDYVRTYAPKGRWRDAWQLFKSNFVRFIIINVLTLVFFIPVVAVIYLRLAYITGLATVYPFSANTGISIFTPSTVGLSERLVLSADLLFYSVMIIAVGVSG